MEGQKNSKNGYFWLKYGNNIILSIGIILIAAISFEAGYLHGQKNKQAPVVVNKTASADISKCESQPMEENGSTSKASNSNSTATETGQSKSETTIQPENQTCAYVASKNSDKYHLASCQWATRIKPENRICFSSAEEAQKRGFQSAKCCIK